MNPLDVVREREAEIRKSLGTVKQQRNAIADKTIAEKRALTDAERAEYDKFSTQRSALKSELAVVTERIAELEADEVRAGSAAETRREKIGRAHV